MNIQQKKKEKMDLNFIVLTVGTFSKDTIETHNNTNKHKNFILILEKNIQ